MVKFRWTINQKLKRITIYGSTTLVGLFAAILLLSSYGVSFSTSGNIFCGSRCESYFNITVTNYSFCFYNTFALYFDPPIIKYELYKADLRYKQTNPTRWKPYNLTGKCLEKGRHEFKIIGYKRPEDTVKWSLAAGINNVDPWWYGKKEEVKTTYMFNLMPGKRIENWIITKTGPEESNVNVVTDQFNQTDACFNFTLLVFPSKFINDLKQYFNDTGITATNLTSYPVKKFRQKFNAPNKLNLSGVSKGKTMQFCINYPGADDYELQLGFGTIYIYTNLSAGVALNNVTCEAGGSYCHLAISEPSLNIYFPFDVNESGTTTTRNWDIFYHIHGTLTGGAFLNSSGKYGWGLQLSGANGQYVTLGDTFNWVTQFTLSSWFFDKGSTDGGMAGRWAASKGYMLHMDGQTLRCYADGINTASTSAVSLNTWHHGVCNWNGTAVRLYIDGVLNSSAATTTLSTSAAGQQWMIGTYATDAGGNFLGSIDEVMYFNRSLSATETAQIYSQQYTRFYPSGNHTIQVRKMNYTGESFSGSPMNTYKPAGLDWNGTHFFVVSEAGDRVTVYNSTWTNITNWSVAAQDSDAYAICHNSTDIAVGGVANVKLFFYYPNNRTYTGRFFTLGNVLPAGCTWNGTDWFITGLDVGWVNGWVEARNTSGGIIRNWSITAQDPTPGGIEYFNSSFWVMGSNNLIYEYNQTMGYTGRSYATSSSASALDGGAFTGDSLWVASLNTGTVYRHFWQDANNRSNIVISMKNQQNATADYTNLNSKILYYDTAWQNTTTLNLTYYNNGANANGTLGMNDSNKTSIDIATILIPDSFRFFSPVILNISMIMNMSAAAPPPPLDCSELNTPNTINTLTQNATSTGTCFNITANNVTLDCNGYGINYSSTTEGYGVISADGNNGTTIKNCVITEDGTPTNSYGIYLTSAYNTTIFNTIISTVPVSSHGIYLDGTFNRANLTSNRIYVNGTSAKGLDIAGSNNSIINNTIALAIGSANAIRTASTNSTFANNTLTGGVSAAVRLDTAGSNNFTGNIINTAGGAEGIRLYSNSHFNKFDRNNITGGSGTGGWVVSSGLYNNLTNSNASSANTGNRSGIYNNTITDTVTLNSNNIVQNNNITASNAGASITGISNLIIDSNITSDYIGISIDGGSNNNITNSTIQTTVSATTGYGIYFPLSYADSGNLFSRVTVTTKIADANAIYADYYSDEFVTVEHNFTIIDSILNASLTQDLKIECSTGCPAGNSWANFTNVTRLNGTSFTRNFTAGTNATLYVWWYLDVNVSNTTGNAVEGATVNATDIFNNLVFDENTGANGRITRKTLQEFKQNRTNTVNYNNYTVNATKIGYDPYSNNSVNMIINVWLNIVLGIPSPDTCTYSGSGNWGINCADYCNIQTKTVVSGIVYAYGTGVVRGWANIIANKKIIGPGCKTI